MKKMQLVDSEEIEVCEEGRMKGGGIKGRGRRGGGGVGCINEVSGRRQGDLLSAYDKDNSLPPTITELVIILRRSWGKEYE